ncbi:helicase HerA domain-containing protein [Thermodesulfobacteriota bacterium]
MPEQSKDNPYEKWNNIAILLLDSGLADSKPLIKHYCNSYFQTQDFSGLQDLITNHPELIQQATALALQKQRQPIPFMPPTKEDAEALQGNLKIGIINNNLEWMHLIPKHMVDNILIIGQRGSGKSYLFFMLMFQLMQIPKNKRPNLIILDRKNDYQCLLNFFPEMHYFDEHTLHDNMWEIPPGHDPAKYLSSQTELLCDIHYFRATSAPIIKQAVRQCYLKNKDKNFNFYNILKEALNYASNKKFKGWNIQDVMAKINIRFDNLISEISLNKEKGFPLDFWQTNDTIINLRGYDEDTARTFTMSLWERLYQDNILKNKRNIPSTIFICDEAYWLFNVEDTHEPNSQKTLADRMRTSREYGIGVIAGTQNTNDINDILKGNCPHVISFRILAQSIKEAQTLLGLDDPQRDFILNLPEKLTGIARIAHYPAPIIFTIPQGPKFNKAITEEEIFKIMKPKLDQLLKIIMPNTHDINIEHMEKMILQTLAGNPFIHFTYLRNKIKKRREITDDQFDIKLRNLVKKGLIESIKCVNACTHKKAEFFPMTDKGHEFLNLAKSKRIPSRIYKHILYCRKVALELKRLGHDPKTEDHRIDVSYRDENNNLYAYEITLSFDNLIDNIHKCLSLNATLITVVTEDKKDLDKAKNMIETVIMDKAILERIAYKRVGEFIPKKGAK